MIIWLASYPKSGNTWLRSLLSAYFYSKDGSFDFDLLKNIGQFPHFDYFKDYKDNFSKPESIANYWLEEQAKINKEKKVRFLKTHNAMCKINNNKFTDENNSLGAIYIIRDPRNVVSSLSNHINLNLSEAFEYMKRENNSFSYKKDGRYLAFVPLLSWILHQKSWVSNKIFPVLTIRYEDLEVKTYETFKKVLLFINEITKSKKKIDNEKLKKSIRSCEFDILQKLEKNKGFPEAWINENKTRNKFFHLGKNNDYNKLLDKKLISQMNEVFQEQIKVFNYK